MIKLLLIGLGSAIGGIVRYLLSNMISESTSSVFPWGTFVVNVIGCFIIGLIYGAVDSGAGISANTRLFLTVGFCGGFTTFSTFAHENYLLFTSGSVLTVAAYGALSFFVGIVMAYAGHAVIKTVI